MWRDVLRALSLANLCLVPIVAVLFLQPVNRYYMATEPGFLDLAALLANMGVLGAAFLLAGWLLRRFRNGFTVRLADLGLLALSAYLLHQIRASVSDPLPGVSIGGLVDLLGKSGLLIGAGLLGIGLMVILARWPDAVLRLYGNGLLALSPFIAVTLGQAGWIAAQTPLTPLRASDAPQRTAGYAAPRVLWLVFDEMDFRLLFQERPVSVKLPAIDRLREEAIFATNAFPPARDTIESFPSLICGRRVERSEEVGADALRLHFREGNEVGSWKEQRTIFTRAREMGLGTGLVGWAHPYSRVLGHDLDVCYWEPYVYWGDRHHLGLPQLMRLQLGMLAGVTSAGRWSQQEQKLHHIAAYKSVVTHAEQVAADPNLQMMMLHFPVPHQPFIFDAAKNQYTLEEAPLLQGYYGNAVLADRALAKVRGALERGKLWDKTTVVLTSDHWLRGYLPDLVHYRRVPFILKAAGARTGEEISEPFNTTALHDLTVELLAGRLHGAKATAKWLRAHQEQPD